MRYELAPEGRAYWRYVERAYEQNGQEVPEHDEPRSNRRNYLAWMCWQWIYPDCLAVGLTATGLLDWHQVAVVLRDFYGVDLAGDLHRRLRICMSEAAAVMAEGKEAGNDGSKDHPQL